MLIIYIYWRWESIKVLRMTVAPLADDAHQAVRAVRVLADAKAVRKLDKKGRDCVHSSCSHSVLARRDKASSRGRHCASNTEAGQERRDLGAATKIPVR